ncbi:hypothetical protein [Pseudoteredinibacter isoporae]|uniref:Plastocyanin n=1 Tax=Pseudoteredinibacter isoporae TaxID=570281 RepID=A0A7X0JWW3_9GAMM|nr:hypothetical protein [Pseudoteredinibacter isoporae]MBB6523738.1 plastocyanin [Pseudoteredinibacter isoporae]NHO89240.1 hypothetical protein [Pseudoteredinibacter isoporae]NIB22149.1 hypothetical protein [Pseudoteredinibacter isoporae]
MFRTPGLVLFVLCLSTVSRVAALDISLQHKGKAQHAPGAVVWLEAKFSLPDHSLRDNKSPAGSEQPPVKVIEQKNRQFDPYISVARLGSNIQFPNRDNTAHHVYSFSKPLSFELPLYKKRTPAPIQVENPGLIALGCNIHDWMIAYLVVVDSPFYGQIEKDSVNFKELPHGHYTLKLWHPDINNGQALTSDLDFQGQTKHNIALPKEVNARAQIAAPQERLDEDEDY